jgi:hypothetical protein
MFEIIAVYSIQQGVPAVEKLNPESIRLSGLS